MEYDVMHANTKGCDGKIRFENVCDDPSENNESIWWDK